MPNATTPLTASTPDEKVHVGHRARMREKLLQFGDQIFDEHELLEMLLYHAIPMRDTNPIAHRLLAVFGTLEGVFSATREELVKVSGVKDKAADLILCVGRVGGFPFFSGKGRERYDSHSMIGKLFVERLGGLESSQTHMMMLTNSMELIGVEKMTDCDFSCAEPFAAQFIVRALKKGASTVILAHNHPYGPLFETQSDHIVGSVFKNGFSRAGILFLEHYIISGGRYISTVGKIDTLKFYQTPEIEGFLKEKENQLNGDISMRP